MSLFSFQTVRPQVPDWLEDLCERLGSNSIDLVDLTHRRINENSARLFADALDGNTSATTIMLSCLSLESMGSIMIGSVIGQSSSLRKVQFRDVSRRGGDPPSIFGAAKVNKSIEELSLRHCYLDEESAPDLTDFLSTNACLQEVRFVDCHFARLTTYECLCAGIAENGNIRRIHFINCNLWTECARELAVILDSLALEELFLCENNLGDSGLEILADAAMKCPTLKSLDIRSNSITVKGAAALAKLLSESSKLQRLALDHNRLGSLGVKELCRGLERSSLTSLDLAYNNIDSDAGIYLAQALTANNTLLELGLSFNRIGDLGFQQVLDAMTRNDKIEKLNLRQNEIGNKGLLYLAEALSRMKTMRSLCIDRNRFTDAAMLELIPALETNLSIERIIVGNTIALSTQRQLDYIAELNQSGRRALRLAMPDGLWPHLYGRVGQDPKLLFYFVRNSPHVIELAAHT